MHGAIGQRGMRHADRIVHERVDIRVRGELGSVLVRATSPQERAEGADLVETARQTFGVLRATAWRHELDSTLESVGSDRS